MKRFFALFLSLLLVSACMPALAEDASLQKVLDKGEFVLGLDESFPPLGFRDEDGNIVGFDVDLAQAVCEVLGVTLKLQPIDWSAKELELNGGNIDCIWNGFTMTPERTEAFSFSVPYLANAQVLVVKADSPYQAQTDLAGKVLGLQAGSSAADALSAAEAFKASLGEIAEFDENMTALMDLENG
ncbi:MAG: transporter substrate-binding domain-containing protein, partial [Clostridia bacterium]